MKTERSGLLKTFEELMADAQAYRALNVGETEDLGEYLGKVIRASEQLPSTAMSWNEMPDCGRQPYIDQALAVRRALIALVTTDKAIDACALKLRTSGEWWSGVKYKDGLRGGILATFGESGVPAAPADPSAPAHAPAPSALKPQPSPWNDGRCATADELKKRVDGLWFEDSSRGADGIFEEYDRALRRETADAKAWRALKIGENPKDPWTFGRILFEASLYGQKFSDLGIAAREVWNDRALVVRRAVIASAVTERALDAAVEATHGFLRDELESTAEWEERKRQQTKAGILAALGEMPSSAPHDPGHPHLVDGEFQSDKYPTCPRGKVPLSVKDESAQDLLWMFAQRHKTKDLQFSVDLEIALKSAGYAALNLWTRPDGERVKITPARVGYYEVTGSGNKYHVLAEVGPDGEVVRHECGHCDFEKEKARADRLEKAVATTVSNLGDLFRDFRSTAENSASHTVATSLFECANRIEAVERRLRRAIDPPAAADAAARPKLDSDKCAQCAHRRSLHGPVASFPCCQSSSEGPCICDSFVEQIPRDNALAPAPKHCGRCDELKENLDAVARALHPHWPEDSRGSYDPEQLPVKIENLRIEVESHRAERLAIRAALECPTARLLEDWARETREQLMTAVEHEKEQATLIQALEEDVATSSRRMSSESARADRAEQKLAEQTKRAEEAEAERTMWVECESRAALARNHYRADRDAQMARVDRLEKAIAMFDKTIESEISEEMPIQKFIVLDRARAELRRAIDPPATDAMPVPTWTEQDAGKPEVSAPNAEAPIPMYLTCPKCSARHVDVGEFATRVHHTHSCQTCGLTWRPAVVATVGVEFLPGFKDETPAVKPTPVSPGSAPVDPCPVGPATIAWMNEDGRGDVVRLSVWLKRCHDDHERRLAAVESYCRPGLDGEKKS